MSAASGFALQIRRSRLRARRPVGRFCRQEIIPACDGRIPTRVRSRFHPIIISRENSHPRPRILRMALYQLIDLVKHLRLEILRAIAPCEIAKYASAIEFRVGQLNGRQAAPPRFLFAPSHCAIPQSVARSRSTPESFGRSPRTQRVHHAAFWPRKKLPQPICVCIGYLGNWSPNAAWSEGFFVGALASVVERNGNKDRDNPRQPTKVFLLSLRQFFTAWARNRSSVGLAIHIRIAIERRERDLILPLASAVWTRDVTGLFGHPRCPENRGESSAVLETVIFLAECRDACACQYCAYSRRSLSPTDFRNQPTRDQACPSSDRNNRARSGRRAKARSSIFCGVGGQNS